MTIQMVHIKRGDSVAQECRRYFSTRMRNNITIPYLFKVTSCFIYESFVSVLYFDRPRHKVRYTFKIHNKLIQETIRIFQNR